MFQSVGVKVSVAGDTVAAPGSSEVISTVTSPVGTVFRLTVYLAAPPSSTSSVLGKIAILGLSSSMMWTVAYTGSPMIIPSPGVGKLSNIMKLSSPSAWVSWVAVMVKEALVSLAPTVMLSGTL